MRNVLTALSFLLVLLLPPATGVRAQTAQLDVRFDSTYILIGDQIGFHVVLEQSGPVTVSFPEWKDTLIKAIEILKVTPRDTAATPEGRLRITQDLVITSFDSGLHFVPPIPFPLYAGGIRDTLFSPVAGLQVFSLPLDTAQAVFDIKPVYRMPVTLREIWAVARWVLLGMLLLAGLIYLWLVAVRKKSPLGFFRTRVIEPPHVVALRDLEHLRSEKLWQNGQIKPYYTRLTDIVRTYISGRYGVNAMESTSDEILAGLKDIGFDDALLYGKLERMFSCADLVKFAKMTPPPTENDTYMLDAVLFVNTTKRSEQPETIQEAVTEDGDSGESGTAGATGAAGRGEKEDAARKETSKDDGQ
ncbi:MAG: hypothetical protein J6X20_00855 [Bacteroidales bacterium]|nr:hypothetical protein [Bacteroidales bacterium]